MNNTINASNLAALASSPTNYARGRGQGSNWFEAFASAWGTALDNQASKIEVMSDALSAGGDRPSDITLLTAESLRMGFISNSSHTSIDSIAKALETMARKG